MQQRAADIAKILGGKPEGAGYLCRCPVRSHGKGRGDLRPSLGVSDGDRGLIVHCFAGCDPREVLAALRKLAPDASPLRAPATPAGGVPPRRAVKTTTDLALRLWRAAIDVAGTPAETYLRSRSLPASPPKTIRFLRSYRYDETRRFPCLVAAVQAPSREHRRRPTHLPRSFRPSQSRGRTPAPRHWPARRRFAAPRSRRRASRPRRRIRNRMGRIASRKRLSRMGDARRRSLWRRYAPAERSPRHHLCRLRRPEPFQRARLLRASSRTRRLDSAAAHHRRRLRANSRIAIRRFKMPPRFSNERRHAKSWRGSSSQRRPNVEACLSG